METNVRFDELEWTITLNQLVDLETAEGILSAKIKGKFVPAAISNDLQTLFINGYKFIGVINRLEEAHKIGAESVNIEGLLGFINETH